MSLVTEIVLFLFVLNLGTAFGAGIYETRIVLPLWFSKPTEGSYRVNTQAMREIDTGRKFWAMVTTMPLTLLTLANLVLAWQRPAGAQHDWWLAAALVTLAERLATFGFFIPTAIKLQKADTLPQEKVNRLVPLWMNVNCLRSLLNLAAFVAALKVLAFGV